MINPIDSISKTVCRPHKSLCVKLKVLMGRKDALGKRKQFLEEYNYTSKKYGEDTDLRSINIDYGEYLVIESVLSWEVRTQNPGLKPMSVWLTNTEIYKLKEMLGIAIKWVTGDELFRLDEAGNPISLRPAASTRIYTLISRSMQNYSEFVLKFSPTLRVISDTRKFERAVNVIMGQSNKQICSMNLDELKGLLDCIENFDLCANAQLLVNQVLLSELFSKK